MATKQPMVGPGVSQWNGWIWFGVQLGSTLWMLLAAAGTAPFAPGLAAVWLLCFAVPNALGTWLWLRRDRMAPHPAYQLLVLLICGSSLSGLLTFDWFWPQGSRGSPSGTRMKSVWSSRGSWPCGSSSNGARRSKRRSHRIAPNQPLQQTGGA